MPYFYVEMSGGNTFCATERDQDCGYCFTSSKKIISLSMLPATLLSAPGHRLFICFLDHQRYLEVPV